MLFFSEWPGVSVYGLSVHTIFLLLFSCDFGSLSFDVKAGWFSLWFLQMLGAVQKSLCWCEQNEPKPTQSMENSSPLLEPAQPSVSPPACSSAAWWSLCSKRYSAPKSGCQLETLWSKPCFSKWMIFSNFWKATHSCFELLLQEDKPWTKLVNWNSGRLI